MDSHLGNHVGSLEGKEGNKDKPNFEQMAAMIQHKLGKHLGCEESDKTDSSASGTKKKPASKK